MSTEIEMLRTSERRAAKRCWQRYEWGNLEGLTTTDPSAALWFGSGVHDVLAYYYGKTGFRRNLDFLDVWEKWCDEGSDDGEYVGAAEYGDKFNLELRALGRAMLKGYHEHWGGDKDWDVIATERTFQVRIPMPDGTHVTYVGTWDGVYRHRVTKKVRLMEHKTAKAISNKHLSLDDQAGSYWAVAYTILAKEGILKPKQGIEGITYNYLRKALPDQRPRNKEGHYLNQDGRVSKSQPAPLFERFEIKRNARERAVQIQKIKNEVHHIRAIKDGSLPVTKNPTADCSWDCSFFQMCEVHDQGGTAWEEFRDAVFVERDPYQYHRKSA
jgi:hypothetical protein